MRVSYLTLGYFPAKLDLRSGADQIAARRIMSITKLNQEIGSGH